MSLTPGDILTFWFEGDASARREKWFKKDAGFDAACAPHTEAIRAARDGAYDAWTATPDGALALIVLLDQLSRNVFRGTAEAFAGDAKALSLARLLVAEGDDRGLAPNQRLFAYLPFEHAETLAGQNESVRLFEHLRDTLGGGTVDYAHRHRDVILRFGRFPHRNASLGRVSTVAEAEYLAQPGAGF